MVNNDPGSTTPRGITRDILVVDDDLGTRETLALLFRSEGFHPVGVEDVFLARRLLAGHSFGLIVLDLYWGSAPKGLELLEALSRERRRDRVAVVTGFATTATTVQAMRLGALTVLEKPADSESLLTLAHTHHPRASETCTLEELYKLLCREDLDIPTFLEVAELCRLRFADKADRSTGVDAVLCRRPFGDRTTKFVQLLEEATTAALTRTEAAWGRHLSVDPAHFGRLLQSETGVGFRVWRRAARIRLAVRLLLGGELAIGQIADRLGCDQSQLSREFFESFGVRPLQFRNRYHEIFRKFY